MKHQQVLSAGLCALLLSAVVDAKFFRRPALAVSDLAALEMAQLPLLPTQPSLSLAQISDAYVLGAGDVIAINIFNVPEYSGTQQVLADGSINLPAVGRVSVKGLTPEQASEAVAVAYQNELRYPQVTVVLETVRPLRIAVSGEVSSPGIYTLTADQERKHG